MRRFNLPIKLEIPVALTIFYGFSFFYFLYLAIDSWTNTHNVQTSVMFILLMLLSIFTFISSRSFIVISNEVLILYSPPLGVYQIKWSEVLSIETNGQFFSFIGDNKILTIALGFISSKRKEEFHNFLNKFGKDNNIDFKPLSYKIFSSNKNTKIRNLYF